MSIETEILFLSENQKLLLVDGYSRKYKHNHQYIPIELCNIIILHFAILFDFFIVFEKYWNDFFNEMVCYDMKSKSKIIKNNNIWKYNYGTSFCVHKTMNDCLIYRIGGLNNKTFPNIEYSIKHDIHIELPFSQTMRAMHQHYSIPYMD